MNLCRFDAASRRVRRHNDCLESSVSWWIDNDSRSSQLSGEVISYRVCEICIECSHSCRGCLSPLCIRLCSSTAMDYIRIARHQIPLQHQPPWTNPRQPSTLVILSSKSRTAREATRPSWELLPPLGLIILRNPFRKRALRISHDFCSGQDFHGSGNLQLLISSNIYPAGSVLTEAVVSPAQGRAPSRCIFSNQSDRSAYITDGCLTRQAPNSSSVEKRRRILLAHCAFYRTAITDPFATVLI